MDGFEDRETGAQAEFEEQLRQAMERRPAPPSLRQKVMDHRQQRKAERSRLRLIWMERIAATIVLAAVLSGAFLWRSTVQRRKGEAARQQVFTALRIASRALDQMNRQLNRNNREDQ